MLSWISTKILLMFQDSWWEHGHNCAAGRDSRQLLKNTSTKVRLTALHCFWIRLLSFAYDLEIERLPRHQILLWLVICRCYWRHANRKQNSKGKFLARWKLQCHRNTPVRMLSWFSDLRPSNVLSIQGNNSIWCRSSSKEPALQFVRVQRQLVFRGHSEACTV